MVATEVPNMPQDKLRLETRGTINYRRVQIDGREIFYREAGPANAPVMVLLHGFPSSSHMFRDLIPKLSDHFHVIAPDYIGFGYSARPSTNEFKYTFANLADNVQKLLFDSLGLKKFGMYVQDYGAPIGFRIASRFPSAISSIIVQNGNAYVEGITAAFDPLRPFWNDRNAETEKPARGMLMAETTKFQYTHGMRDVSKVNPDSYMFDQALLDRPGNHDIQLSLLHDYTSNIELYPKWHAYFRTHRPPMLIVWGANDPFFSVIGAKSYLADLPTAELHLLDSGHFALEEECDTIADYICKFANKEMKTK